MGLPFSAFNKFGLPGLSTLPTGQIYDRYFKNKKTDTFPDFHIAYVDFCKYFNTVMPGKDFHTPSLEQLKDFFENTWKPLDADQRRIEFMKYMENIKEANDDSLFIMAGLAAPAAAIAAKRAGQSIPQLKKFRLEYFPNVVFVPLCTLVAIMGATAVQMNKKPKPT